MGGGGVAVVVVVVVVVVLVDIIILIVDIVVIVVVVGSLVDAFTTAIIAITMTMIIDAVVFYTLLQRQGKGQGTLVAYAVSTEVQILYISIGGEERVER